MTKTVLITGGAGFIGSHLCGFLLDKGNKVFCLDNLLTGNKKNIEQFLDNPEFDFLEHDITTPLHIKEDIDEVYSLASPASPIDYANLPIETLLVNSYGVRNALDLAKEKGARFLQASTSEVYGDPLEHPQKESYFGNVNSIGPRSCYDEGKRFAEALVMAYHRKHNLDTKIVRIFNTYGPRMRVNDGRVIPNFMMQALRNEPITVYGDGSQTRSFCFVNDLVDGLCLMMGSPDSGPMNLGNPAEITIKELAEIIISITDSSSEIVFRELPGEDPVRRKPDIGRAKEILGWEPEIGLHAGIAKALPYFRALL